MNKSSIHILLLLTMLSWLLGSCDHPSTSDSSLVHLDSLLSQRPDSALELLVGIDASQFHSEGDRAYYALLLTQANYKCYVTATSDSLINIALDYYTRHRGEREKLTRALIYKGAVMEELGQPEEAIVYYKDAQNTVADVDAFNQGYIRLRLGNIYRNQFVADSTDIMMFKEALRYFKEVPDSFYILTCLTEIGSSYTKTNPDSMLPYLYQADELALKLNEKSLKQINDIYIAEKKMFSPDPRDVEAAKQIALSLLNDKNASADDQEDVLMIAAYTLAKQHKTDSASIYLNQVSLDALASPNDTVFYYSCSAEIAAARGNVDQYKLFDERADQKSDSLLSNALQLQLRDIETKYDNEVLKNKNMHYKNLLTSGVLGGLLLLSLLAITILLISKRNIQQRQRIKENEDTIERLHDETAQLNALLSDNQVMNERLKSTIRGQIDTFAQLVEEHRKEFVNTTTRFDKLLKEKYSANEPDNTFWDDLRSYVDYTCNDIIHQTEASHPSLIESDVRFLTLYCCDLPTTVIMACMGYNDPHSVYNKRHRVRELLGLSGSLDEYITKWKNHRKSSTDREE